MKKQFGFISIFFVASLLWACAGHDIAYEKTYTFENNMMTSSNPCVFEFENGKDTFQLYDINIAILHKKGIGYHQIPIMLGYSAPNGYSTSVPIALPVYDEKYHELGEQQSDSTFVIKETIIHSNSMQTGKNIFTITPATRNDTIFGVSAVTLTIEKVN